MNDLARMLHPQSRKRLLGQARSHLGFRVLRFRVFGFHGFRVWGFKVFSFGV